MKKEIIYPFLMIGVLFIYGCSSDTPVGVGLQQIDSEIGEVQKITATLNQLAGTTSQYFRFDKVHYEQSLQEGKVIFLDFHANWCPICAREKPKILAAFNELDNPDIVGYEVHFNDGQTNDDDKAITKKYGIVNQYTKVILDPNDNVVLKTLEILDKERIINELQKVAGG
jgi:thiol-disulfide isomerase/thioredoxin